MPIKFKSLIVHRMFGKVQGKITVSGDYGETELKLSEEQCNDILAICADSLVEAATEIADHMKSEVARIDVISGRAIESEEAHRDADQ
ncbi:hypothetical protein [Profundibacter sp.]